MLFNRGNAHWLQTGGFPIPHESIALPVRGTIEVARVGTVNGIEYADVDIEARCGISNNGVGDVDTLFTGGKVVELNSDGRPTGRELQFRLEDTTEGRYVHPTVGHDASLGHARVRIPTGHAYRVEISTATNLPDRAGEAMTDITRTNSFTPVR